MPLSSACTPTIPSLFCCTSLPAAIAAGAQLSSTMPGNISVDFHGRPRTSLTAPDIGAVSGSSTGSGSFKVCSCCSSWRTGHVSKNTSIQSFDCSTMLCSSWILKRPSSQARTYLSTTTRVHCTIPCPCTRSIWHCMPSHSVHCRPLSCRLLRLSPLCLPPSLPSTSPRPGTQWTGQPSGHMTTGGGHL
jgi:hypothetical protein